MQIGQDRHLAYEHSWFLTYNSTKPYAKQPLEETQSEMGLSSVDNVKKLTLSTAMPFLYQIDNLGLGEHKEFPDDEVNMKLHTNADIHQRIILRHDGAVGGCAQNHDVVIGRRAHQVLVHDLGILVCCV